MDRITGPADNQESMVQRVQGNTVEQASEKNDRGAFGHSKFPKAANSRLYLL